MDEIKKLICKFCKVEVVGRLDLRAKHIGTDHSKNCPRRNRSSNPRFQK